LQYNYITISLGLPVEETEHLIEIGVRKADPVALCPRCGHPTEAFHDERINDVWKGLQAGGDSHLSRSRCGQGSPAREE